MNSSKLKVFLCEKGMAQYEILTTAKNNIAVFNEYLLWKRN